LEQELSFQTFLPYIDDISKFDLELLEQVFQPTVKGNEIKIKRI